MVAGKVVIVTGAAGGIGRAAVARFAEEGATVVAADRMPAPQPAVEGAGAYASAELTDDDAVRALIADTVEAHGRLDALYCNHGITTAEPFLASTTDHVDAMIAVNLRSVYVLNLEAARAMAKSGGGAIVNTASSAALKPMPTLAAYAMTKGAVLHLTRALALELASEGVRVNAICPGIIDTEMPRRAIRELPAEAREQAIADMASAHPIGRLGRPEEIAALAVYLCSDAAAYMTGAVIPLDGGISVS